MGLGAVAEAGCLEESTLFERCFGGSETDTCEIRVRSQIAPQTLWMSG